MSIEEKLKIVRKEGLSLMNEVRCLYPVCASSYLFMLGRSASGQNLHRKAKYCYHTEFGAGFRLRSGLAEHEAG